MNPQRRNVLIALSTISLAGCAAVIFSGGGAAYIYREEIANFVCRKISCDKGYVTESELEGVIREKVDIFATISRSSGNDITPEDIETRVKEEMIIAKRALRQQGVSVVPDSDIGPNK